MEGYRDSSDVAYDFRAIKSLKDQDDARRASIQKNTASVTASAWKMYTSDQAIKTKELLNQTINNPKFIDIKTTPNEPRFLNVYESNPEYANNNLIKKAFTPSGGRVVPTEAGKIAIDSGTLTTTGKKIMDPGLTNFTGKNSYMNKVVGFNPKPEPNYKIGTGKLAKQGIDKLGEFFDGSQIGKGKLIKDLKGSIGNMVPDKTKELLKSINPAKYSKAIGVAGIALNVGDFIANQDKMSGTKKAASIASTGLAAASLFNPALAGYSLLASLGTGMMR